MKRNRKTLYSQTNKRRAPYHPAWILAVIVIAYCAVPVITVLIPAFLSLGAVFAAAPALSLLGLAVLGALALIIFCLIMSCIC